VVAGAKLLQAAWGTPLAAWCGLYAATLIAVYVFSTLSHAVYEPEARKLWRALDQGTIYGLIAGTYTPFAAFYLPTDCVVVAGRGLAGSVRRLLVEGRCQAPR